MINLLRLQASEAERIAYWEGFTGTAELFKRIVDLEDKVNQLENEVCRLDSALAELEANQ